MAIGRLWFVFTSQIQGEAALSEEWISRGVGRREVGGRMVAGAQRRPKERVRGWSNPSIVGNGGLPPMALSQQQLNPRHMIGQYVRGGRNTNTNRGAEGRERSMMKEFMSTQMLLESARERLDDMPSVYI